MKKMNTDLLKKNLQSAQKAKNWLERSYKQSHNINFSKPLSENEMDSLEALTSRFARLADILIHKVFRTIEITEFEIPGTLIDTVNRMAKRGLVDEIDDIRQIKDLRNVISHEYEEEALILLMQDCIKHTPELFQIFDKIQKYCLDKEYL